MSKAARVVGYIWAAPLTLLGLVYVTLFTLLGWYKRTGVYDDALVWNVDQERAPNWLNKLWKRWDGHTIGNVVVLKPAVNSDRGKVIVKHELVHVHQCMVLGVFQPILYGLASFGLMFCMHAHPYYDNPFEIDARRAAGQVIDVIGAVRLAVAQGKIKLPSKKK